MPNANRQLPARVLEKVRALLAKAESTAFESEAEALTAKAQELMARYRIERAMLDADGPRGSNEPSARRIRVDDPYAHAKALLLASIADTNGCRAVWSAELGWSTVFGFEDELAAVEELFTSLLVQATRALQRAGPKRDRFGRSRTTRFRRSFLVAFAVRVGQRLRDTVDATVNDMSVATGTALVPLLARRAAAAADAARAAFPHTRPASPPVSDGEGWHAGTAFGDQVNLGADSSIDVGLIVSSLPSSL